MSVTIKAKCFNGQSYDLTFDSSAPTVNDLQSSISSASGITPDRQTILFKGQVLEPGSFLSDYSLADGHTISVVRRIGKSTSKSSTKPPPVSKPRAAPPASATPANSQPAVDPSAPQPPSLEDMMRSLNMGAGAGAAPPLGGGAAGVPPMPDLSALLGGADPSTLGAPGGPAAGGAGGLEQLFAQLPQMMNGFFNTPMLQDYLNDPEKQEQRNNFV